MSQKSKNKILSASAGIMALAITLFCGAASAAQTGVDADPLLDGDTYGAVTYTGGSGGSITVSFAAQSETAPPAVNAGSTVADVGVSEGAFVGNYVDADVQTLKFNVTGDGHLPGSIMVILKNSDGRTWCNENVNVSETNGVMAVNEISFDRSSGWDRNERSTVDKDALWQSDLQDVAVIGVRITQGGIEAQSYTISEFVLYDSNGSGSGSADLTPLEQALLDSFGTTDMERLSEEDASRDLDGDGMTDLTEIRSEYEAGYAESIFVAEILENTAEGITITWPSVKGADYTVLRSGNLLEGFTVLNGAVDMTAHDTGFMTYTDTTAGDSGQYFYKILKREP